LNPLELAALSTPSDGPIVGSLAGGAVIADISGLGSAELIIHDDVDQSGILIA